MIRIQHYFHPGLKVLAQVLNLVYHPRTFFLSNRLMMTSLPWDRPNLSIYTSWKLEISRRPPWIGGWAGSRRTGQRRDISFQWKCRRCSCCISTWSCYRKTWFSHHRFTSSSIGRGQYCVWYEWQLSSQWTSVYTPSSELSHFAATTMNSLRWAWM